MTVQASAAADALENAGDGLLLGDVPLRPREGRGRSPPVQLLLAEVEVLTSEVPFFGGDIQLPTVEVLRASAGRFPPDVLGVEGARADVVDPAPFAVRASGRSRRAARGR